MHTFSSTRFSRLDILISSFISLARSFSSLRCFVSAAYQYEKIDGEHRKDNDLLLLIQLFGTFPLQLTSSRWALNILSRISSFLFSSSCFSSALSLIFCKRISFYTIEVISFFWEERLSASQHFTLVSALTYFSRIFSMRTYSCRMHDPTVPV